MRRTHCGALQLQLHQQLLLRAGYRCVLVAPVDAFLVPFPATWPGGLRQFLRRFAGDPSAYLRPLAFAVSHDPPPEPPARTARRLAEQRAKPRAPPDPTPPGPLPGLSPEPSSEYSEPIDWGGAVTLGSVLRRRRFWGASPRDALPCLSKVPLDFAPQQLPANRPRY